METERLGSIKNDPQIKTMGRDPFNYLDAREPPPKPSAELIAQPFQFPFAATALSQMELIEEDKLKDPSIFPPGRLDEDGQQVDLRHIPNGHAVPHQIQGWKTR